MWANLSSIPLLVLLVPPLALFGGSFSLYQFSVMYVNLARLVQRPATGSIWKAVRPYVRPVVKNLQSVLGDEDKFLSKIQPTHVILCAILLVLIVFLERVITQLSATPPPRRSK